MEAVDVFVAPLPAPSYACPRRRAPAPLPADADPPACRMDLLQKMGALWGVAANRVDFFLNHYKPRSAPPAPAVREPRSRARPASTSTGCTWRTMWCPWAACWCHGTCAPASRRCAPPPRSPTHSTRCASWSAWRCACTWLSRCCWWERQVRGGGTVSEELTAVAASGNGKTAVVQHLAAQVGAKLLVQNLNQQSDSSDFLGAEPAQCRAMPRSAVPRCDRAPLSTAARRQAASSQWICARCACL
jgi:hypothetical protein